MPSNGAGEPAATGSAPLELELIDVELIDVELSDVQLIEVVVPRPSFATTYQELHTAMVRLAYLLVGSTELAEDITQDAFVGLHRQYAKVNEPAAYLRRSVINGAKTHHRRVARDRARARGVARADAELGADELVDALAVLPARQREALVLRYHHDLPDARIADALGVKVGTVASLIHRGLAELRKVIEP